MSSSAGATSVNPLSASSAASPGGMGGGFVGVQSPLEPHLRALDLYLQGQLGAFEPEIRDMADYCIDTSGKRIRPTLVFLSAWRDGVVRDDIVRAAAVVELVHLATLVHDDIMDGAEVRRGRPTAARKYGPVAAVLLGDALFAHALHLATEFPTTEVCAAVSASTRRVCAGEIVQTLRRGTMNIARSDYDRIVDLKTAELFRVSCQLGARLAGFEPEYVAAVASFGRHLGIAYQIYDDLVDFFGEEAAIGKTLGTDLASGKLTLPLILLRERLPAAEAAALAEELVAARAPQPELRLAQMREFDVFAGVEAVVEAELAQALAGLQPFAGHPPTAPLGQLTGVLRRQVAALRPRR